MSFIDRFIPGRGQAARLAVQAEKDAAVGGTHVTIGAGGNQMSMEQVLGAASDTMQGHNIAATLQLISPHPELGVSPLDIIAQQQGFPLEMKAAMVQIALNQAFGVTTPLVANMREAVARQREEAEAAKLVAEWEALPRKVRIARQALQMVVRSAHTAIRPFTISAEIQRLGSDEPEQKW